MAKSPLAGSRVLVAEDELFIAFELQVLLEEQSVDVIGPVPNVGEAQELFAGVGPFDLAILDVMLKDGEVTPLLQQICDAGIPVVLYTGTPQVVQAFAGRDGVVIVEKPIETAEVIRQAGTLLEQRRAP